MKSVREKKLLVLAGTDVNRKLVETSMKMGVYTIVADNSENSSCKRIADEAHQISIMDVDGLVELCRKEGIDGVANFCNDPAAKSVQQVSEKMGYPSTGTLEQVMTFSDKIRFKAACARHGIDTIPEFTEEDIANGTVNYPVMVKPIDARGSAGTIVCDSAADLDDAMRTARATETSASGKIIIEKYLNGLSEISATYIIINGEPYLISVGDRHSGRKEDNVDRILSCMIQPSWAKQLYLSKVDPKFKNMIRDLGIQNAMVFTQGLVDGDTIRLFDCGYHCAGNEYERAFAAATGLNPMESVVTYALTGEMEDFGGRYEGSYDLNGKVAVQYMINCRPGKISRYAGIEEIKKHPDVVYVGYKHELGDVIKNTGSTQHRVFDITFVVDRTEQAVNEAVDYVNNHLHVFDENNEDMIVSRFDFRTVAHKYDWAKENNGRRDR